LIGALFVAVYQQFTRPDHGKAALAYRALRVGHLPPKGIGTI
jgi:hypothetical protein